MNSAQAISSRQTKPRRTVQSIAAVGVIAAIGSMSEVNANLIVNGDFEAGNSGFTSDYTFGSLADGATVYSIVNDPATDHPQATSYGDNTTGAGLMMAVNGCCEPPVSPIPVVWSQTISVESNTDYLFSLFVSSWFPASPAILDVSAVELGNIGVVTAPLDAGVWDAFEVVFSTGTNTAITLQIVDINVLPFGAGNDFAIDDITLTTVPVPAPAPVALLPLGIALMTLRRFYSRFVGAR